MPQIDRELWEDIQSVLDHDEPPRTKLPYYCGTVDGLKVYLVDGDKVKVTPRKGKSNRGYDETDHMDMVEGGNTVEDPGLYQAVWGKPKPRGTEEAYLDDNIKKHDRPFILYHELIEVRHMKKGLSYDAAHKLANAGEKQLRIEARGACDTCKREPCVCKK